MTPDTWNMEVPIGGGVLKEPPTISAYDPAGRIDGEVVSVSVVGPELLSLIFQFAKSILVFPELYNSIHSCDCPPSANTSLITIFGIGICVGEGIIAVTTLPVDVAESEK